MERIDIHNYEAYLLDFSEGALCSDRQIELELFLIQHPELKIDLNELSLVQFEKDEILFGEKESLKKSAPDLISEAQFISYIENQLSHEEQFNLEKSCASNPSLATELELYRQTITKADASIIYSNKSELKRKPKVIWFNFSGARYAAAACILFLIGLFILWPKNHTNSITHELADHTKIKNSPLAKSDSGTSKKKETDLERKIEASLTIAQNTRQEKSKTKNTKGLLQNSTRLDTITQTTSNEPVPVKELKTNEPLIASNALPLNKTEVQIITENEDESPVANANKKKGIWAIASKALKNLNRAGVKSVNGDEDQNKEKASYVLTLGGLNIAHKASNL